MVNDIQKVISNNEKSKYQGIEMDKNKSAGDGKSTQPDVLVEIEVSEENISILKKVWCLQKIKKKIK